MLDLEDLIGISFVRVAHPDPDPDPDQAVTLLARVTANVCVAGDFVGIGGRGDADAVTIEGPHCADNTAASFGSVTMSAITSPVVRPHQRWIFFSFHQRCAERFRNRTLCTDHMRSRLR
ncbi:MAG: hypothetical protein ACR2RL_03155 [Gammaproteobacteria bacterium]